MSFFITLIELTDANRRELELIPKVNSMIHHGLTVDEYRAFLHDLYHIVWHFCPVMAASAARCDDRFRNVRYELYERIEEEKGHETWVLEDIEAMGLVSKHLGADSGVSGISTCGASLLRPSSQLPACVLAATS